MKDHLKQKELYLMLQKAIYYEDNGESIKALELYNHCILQGIDGNFAYDKLVWYYYEQSDILNVIRVLKRAVDVFTNEVSEKRVDKQNKLQKYKEQLSLYEKINV